MNKKNMLFIVLCAISAMQAILPAQSNESQKGWKALSKAYATSLISGGLIGSVTGLLSMQAIARSLNSSDCLLKKHNNDVGAATFGIIVPILVLISEYKLRSTLINDINQNFEENEIKHSKNLVRDTAWIASWIAFLSCYRF